MPVPSAISDLSTTPASNSPTGSETPSSIDDYLRTSFAFIRQLDTGKYGKNTILGTVSQTAGIPTGAIIESGSNAVGSYIRYADGTQICRNTSGVVMSTTSVSGTGFTSPAVLAFSFPAAFTSPPNMSTTGVFATGDDAWVTARSVTATGFSAVASAFSSIAQTYPSYVAVGRWF